MGPKTFVTCYVCFKEFGSRSIPFHEPKCLERWRSSNKNLPAEKRIPTPVKPVGWKYSEDNTWVCSRCQVSVSAAERREHASICFDKKPKSTSLQVNNTSGGKNSMAGDVKTDFSPKKGKENKNISNHIPVPNVGRKNAKNEAKSESVNKKNPQEETSPASGEDKCTAIDELCKQDDKMSDDVQQVKEDTPSSTSKRSIRPQTKILRRPTPNLKHPVIQVDSDDSSGDSSCSSDKVKEDNPKRLKMGNENPDSSHKRKNFIMYNKYNVEKNTKNSLKERTSASLPSSIPNPCNSCNRSQAPERLHSHARRDARGLMYRRSPSVDIKMASPQKKVLDTIEREKVKNKDSKHVPVSECVKDNKSYSKTEVPTPEVKKESFEAPSDQCREGASNVEQELLDLIKTCYICQKEFNASSLLMHESKCLENWKKTNNALNPNLRQLPPRKPDEDGLLPTDEADPAWSAVQSQLVPCPVCERTFFPERLPIHRRVCKGKPSPRPLKRASSLREQSTSSRDGEEPRPAAIYLPCYVCGRNYGSWVIPMHEQQCLRRWRRENEKLPDDQQQTEPQKFIGTASDDDVASLVELGDNAWESHLQQLVPCPRCSRTFFPDRLEVHERSCKGPSCSRRPRSNKGA